jgi:hypothetical protein
VVTCQFAEWTNADLPGSRAGLVLISWVSWLAHDRSARLPDWPRADLFSNDLLNILTAQVLICTVYDWTNADLPGSQTRLLLISRVSWLALHRSARLLDFPLAQCWSVRGDGTNADLPSIWTGLAPICQAYRLDWCCVRYLCRPSADLLVIWAGLLLIC